MTDDDLRAMIDHPSGVSRIETKALLFGIVLGALVGSALMWALMA